MLYILTGLPYSGKSTLARELVKSYGYETVSMDAIMDRDGLDSETMSQENWDKVYKEGYEQLKRLLYSGKNVILDMGNLKRSERNTARNIAESLGCKYKLIYVNTSKKEVLARWQRNQITRTRGHLAKKGLNRAMKMWNEPSADEKPIIYNQKTDLDKWKNKNIK